MYPTVAYEISKARIAEQRHRAEQDEIAQAARQAHRGSTAQPPRLAIALAGRVLIMLAARGRTALAQPRPRTACTPAAPCTSCS